ncbi:MAG: hypothetical protein R3F39_03745 [Myxococcota bacterium]
MLLRFALVLALGFAALGAAACDTPKVGSDAETDAQAEVSPDAAADLGLPDSGQPEILDSSGTDSLIEDSELPPAPSPSFAVGTNPFGVSDSAQFVALTEGAEFRVEKGTQGAWMVVVAVRTAGMLVGDIDLEARLWVDGVDEGGVIRTGLKPVRAADGYDYLYSLPLIVDGPEIAGSTATLVVEASGKTSGSAEQTLTVRLTGGTLP